MRFALVLCFCLSTVSALAAERPVIAVFDIEAKDTSLSVKTLSSLTDYLTASLAASYRVVPRAEVKARLREGQKESFNACVDESCQIAIGKELAAQKSLQTKIARIGKTCITSSVLYDLTRGTSETSATAEGPCTEEAAVKSLKQIIAQLGPKEAVPAPPVDAKKPESIVEGTYRTAQGTTLQIYKQEKSFGAVRTVKNEPPATGVLLEDGGLIAVGLGTGRLGVNIYKVDGGLIRETRSIATDGAYRAEGVDAFAGPPGLNGSYNVTNGVFGNGNRYTGVVTIKPIGKEKYRLEWNVAGSKWTALGMLVGDRLAVTWGTEGSGALLLYQLTEGRLEGRAARFEFASPDVVVETLKRD